MMTKILTAVLGTLVISHAAIAIPRVESRISEIPVYNSQARAITIGNLCAILKQGTVDLGKKARASCQNAGGGVIQVNFSSGSLKAAILGNATDKMVVEYRGSDEIHSYLNNLGQSLQMNFEFVNTGTSPAPGGGGIEHGYYRGDVYVANSDGRFRFGYFFNQKQ